jgi:hypothetical protein
MVTAAMMPKDDGGVVDHELKVYGTTNLRVVCRSTDFSLSGADMARFRLTLRFFPL